MLTQIMEPVSFIETDSADNDVAVALKKAEDGKQFYITGVVASFSGTATKKITIKQISTDATPVEEILLEYTIFNNGQLNFINPISGEFGMSVSAELEASGAGGNTGTIYLLGFSK